ncbi:MAG: hypothetical protein ACRDG4_07825 [Chloroflexota bacterium]
MLAVYLPHAVYALPGSLAKHLGLDPALVRGGLERLTADGRAEAATVPGLGECFIYLEGNVPSGVV